MTANRRPVHMTAEKNTHDLLTSASASEPVAKSRPGHGYRRQRHAQKAVGTRPKDAADMPSGAIQHSIQAPPQHLAHGWAQTPISASVEEGPSKRLAEAVAAVLAYPGYALVVTPTPAHVAVTVTPAAGTAPADVERLAHVVREVLALRGLGRWRALVQIRPPEIVLLREVEEVPDP